MTITYVLKSLRFIKGADPDRIYTRNPATVESKRMSGTILSVGARYEIEPDFPVADHEAQMDSWP